MACTESDELIPDWLYDAESAGSSNNCYLPTNELKYTDSIVVTRLYNLARTVHDVLTDVGVKYWTSGGTTLGCVRHNGLIPWDDDMDICVYKRDVQVLLDKAKPIFDTIGFAIVEAPTLGYRIFHNTDAVCVPYHDHRYPFCDVFVMKQNGMNECYIADGCGRSLWPNEVYNVKDTIKTQLMPFGNFCLNCPDNVDGYLERMYGSNWRQEGVTHDYNHITKTFLKSVKFNLTKDLCQPAKPFQ